MDFFVFRTEYGGTADFPVLKYGDLAPEYQALHDKYRGTAAGQFVLRLYREERCC